MLRILSHSARPVQGKDLLRYFVECPTTKNVGFGKTTIGGRNRVGFRSISSRTLSVGNRVGNTYTLLAIHSAA
jgi:hypothetical protein